MFLAKSPTIYYSTVGVLSDMEFIIIIEETFIIFFLNCLLPFNLGNPNEPRYLESWQFICCRDSNSSSSVLNPGMNSQVKNQMCISEHLSSPTVFSEVTIFSFICMFCRSLFVLLYFFFWSLPDDVLYDLRVARIFPDDRWNTDYTYDFDQTASPRTLQADGDPPSKYTVM
jgi:hypothetical protein